MRRNIIDIDISKPLKPEHVGVLTATYDTNANAIGVNVFRNGAAVDLSGCTVMGYFTQNGQTIKLIGTAEGNTAYVVMRRSCYMVQGRFRLAVTIRDGARQLTVRIVDGYNQNTITDDELWKTVVFSMAMQSGLNTVSLAWIPNVVADAYYIYEVVDGEYELIEMAIKPEIIIEGVAVGTHTYAVQPLIGNEMGEYKTTQVYVSDVFVPGDEPDEPIIPDAPAVVTLSVDDYGNATVTGAILTVDAEGNATLTGYVPSVDGDGDATIE